eukprot:TRINITY_DN6067_c1_g1_i1.p1 TRINITY_DN6067_c1_g1~~TRINITY_DN6067_c1_g1_i1.p1  ORF type:complete len:651 (-),score=58.20 TRINITY_DN6067_c1_g1_i1:656-2545(-)
MIHARLQRDMFVPILLIFLPFAVVCVLTPTNQNVNIHTIFLTECSMYFEWQTLGVVYSIKRSGHPGPVVRVMCCTEEQRKSLTREYLELAPTHIAPSYTVHPVTGDVYSAYNKPLAVIDYMEKMGDTIEEDYVMVMDADMLIRLPLIPAELGVKRGIATGAYFGYLKGVTNDLAKRHIGHVKPRDDTEGGQPRGRRADQIGGFIVMHKNDLSNMARDWLKFTEDVRADPHAWNETGDAYSIHPGDKPWISEMYGYVFAAANNDIWHKPDRTSMLYPEYTPSEPPRILHYGLYFKIEDYEFDKHWFYSFDPVSCGPFDFNAKKPKNGLFRHPPRPTELKSYKHKNKPQMGMEYLRDLLGIETIVTLNNAFCEHHLANCPKQRDLEKECKIAKDMEKELLQEYRDLDAVPAGSPGSWCSDMQAKCAEWAADNQCEENPGYMTMYCKASCQSCRPLLPKVLQQDLVKEKQEMKQNKPQSILDKIRSKEDPIASDIDQQQVAILRHKCLNSASLSAAEVDKCLKAAEKGVVYEANNSKYNFLINPYDSGSSSPQQLLNDDEQEEKTVQGGQNLDQMIERIRQEESQMRIQVGNSNGKTWKWLEGFAVWLLVMAALLMVISKSLRKSKLPARTL